MSTLFGFRYESLASGKLVETLLIFSGPGKLRSERLASMIELEIQTHLVPDQVVVLVPDTRWEECSNQFQRDPILETALNRFGRSVQVFLTSFDKAGSTSRTKVIRGDASAEPDLGSIVRRGVTHIFLKHGGFVDSTDTYHFVNPSGRHTNRFIRLSNILVETAEIAFLAFGSLRHIGDEVERVFIDTPAAFAILATVNEFRRDFGQETVEIENFRSYDGRRRVDRFEGEKSIVYISASSSGGLAKELKSASGFKDSELVHLLFLGRTKTEFALVCDLSKDAKENPEGIDALPTVYSESECSICRSGSFTVHLKGDQFDIRGPQPEPVLIRKNDAPVALADTISRLAGTGALTLKLSHAGSPRNRDLYIETDRLLSSAKYLDRLSFFFQRTLPNSITHVLPVDKGSESLAQNIAAFVGKNGGGCAVVEVGKLDVASYGENATIVIAAAAIESGRCLTDVSRDLRTLAPRAPQIFIVGVQKTNGTPRREALRNTLVQCALPMQHEFVAVETIVLPSSQSHNAWTEELSFLKLPTTKSAFQSLSGQLYSARLALLSSANPFNDELFLKSNNGADLKLQAGFVFWPQGLPDEPHSQADVFFTIASVLQQLRANAHTVGKGSALRSNWFHQSVLDPSNFVRFNDDIIQASLLRAATRSELNYAESPYESREMARIVTRIVLAHQSPRGGAAPEFLLAIATGRLRLQPEHRGQVLEAASQCGGMLSALAKAAQV